MNNKNAAGRIQRVARFRDGSWTWVDDTVSEEVTLHITWKDKLTARTGSTSLRAWPCDLEQLALGHVLLECLAPDLDGRAQPFARTGTVVHADAYAYAVTLEPARPGPLPSPPASLDAPTLLCAMRAFISEEGLWDDTGCFHRAGVFDPCGQTLLARAEDIGRHNCLDRLAGWSAATDTPLNGNILLTSARLTASMTAKALRAGFHVLVSRSAVTSAAIALANEARATLIGFARTGEGRFTLFADTPGRLTVPADKA